MLNKLKNFTINTDRIDPALEKAYKILENKTDEISRKMEELEINRQDIENIWMQRNPIEYFAYLKCQEILSKHIDIESVAKPVAELVAKLDKLDIEKLSRKPLKEHLQDALKLKDTRSLTDNLSDTIDRSMDSRTRKPLTEQLKTAIKLRSNNDAPSINHSTVEKNRGGR